MDEETGSVGNAEYHWDLNELEAVAHTANSLNFLPPTIAKYVGSELADTLVSMVTLKLGCEVVDSEDEEHDDFSEVGGVCGG